MRITGILIICFCFLSACGGGGSGDKNSTENNPSSSSSSSANYSVTPITEKSAARLVGAFLDTLSLANQPPQLSLEYELADGKKTGKCDNNTGSYEVTITDSGKKIAESYNNCRALIFYTENTGEDLTLSGKQTKIQSKNNNQEIIQYSWDNFSYIDYSSEKETLHGSTEFKNSDKNISTKINASVENSRQGKLEINNFNVELDKNLKNHLNILLANGNINLTNVAAANIQYVAAEAKINLAGLNSNLKIYESNKKINIDLDSDNNGVIDAAVSLPPEMIESLSEKSMLTNTSPIITEASHHINLNSLKLKPFSLKENFTHPSGHLLRMHLEFIEGNENDWQRADATSFALQNPGSKVYTTYRFYAYATDGFGNQSQKIDMTVHISADTDEDGNFDIYDGDDDNDGVGDGYDAFPLDPTESKDTDGDGIGDNKDPDIDNDNTPNELDAYPLDHNCKSPEEGDGKYCFQSIMPPNVLFIDKDGIFYVQSLSKIIAGEHNGMHNIIKWDSAQQRVIEVVNDVIPNKALGGIYIPSTHLFLFHYQDSKTIYVYNPVTNEVAPYFEHQERILTFTTEKDYLILTVLYSNGEIFYESYNSDGVLVSKKNSLTDINDTPTTIVFRNSDLIPFCKISIAIDSDGQFIEVGDRANRWLDPCNNGYQQLISLDGNFAVLSGYEYYNGDAGICNLSGERVRPADWGLSYRSAWSHIGLTYAYHNNSRIELNVINPYGEKLFTRALPEGNYEPHIYFSNNKIIVFSYQEKGGIRIGVYDEELTPIIK